MLRHILDAHGGELPDNARVCFANTGMECEETLTFVAECAQRWSVSVTWLEYRHVPTAKGGMRDLKHRHEVVGHNSAARRGEPFDAMIAAKAMLPHQGMRLCTDRLKREPVRWWAQRELGWPQFRNILGIRDDEPKRVRKALFEECSAVYPMVLAGVTREIVRGWWKRQPFDLDLEDDEGNCTLCFLKGAGKLRRLIRRAPGKADWWIKREELGFQAENWIRRLSPRQARFSKRWTYAELRRQALNEPELPYKDDDEPAIDCFCGD